VLFTKPFLFYGSIEEHFSKTHSVHGLLLGLSESWKSVPIIICQCLKVNSHFITHSLLQEF